MANHGDLDNLEFNTQTLGEWTSQRTPLTRIKLTKLPLEVSWLSEALKMARSPGGYHPMFGINTAYFPAQFLDALRSTL